LNFFWIKTTIYLSLGLHKERPSYKSSLQLSQKMPSNTSKHELLKKFSTFVGHFCPLDPDPDSESGSGSTDPIKERSATLQFPDQLIDPEEEEAVEGSGARLGDAQVVRVRLLGESAVGGGGGEGAAQQGLAAFPPLLAG
jgi:hypothetical protein